MRKIHFWHPECMVFSCRKPLQMVGIVSTVTICGMLDNESGSALSKVDTKICVGKHRWIFVEEGEVPERWEQERSSG